jgi:hypothetical protein
VKGDRPVTCRHCNSTVSPGSRFCGTCGAAVPLDAREPIPTHGAPWTLIIIMALPLVMIGAIGLAVATIASPSVSQTGGGAVTQVTSSTSDSTTKKNPTDDGEPPPKASDKSQSKKPNGQPAKEASGPAPGYNLVQTPDRGLSAEVPQSWGVETGENSEKGGGTGTWSYYAGVYISSSITTAPNLDAWYGGEGGSTGAYFVASRSLAQDHTNYELTHSLFNANKEEICTSAGPYENYKRLPYSVNRQIWYGCGVDGATVYTIAIAPEGRECVAVLNARIQDGAEQEAIQHLVNTVEVDCARVTS